MTNKEKLDNVFGETDVLWLEKRIWDSREGFNKLISWRINVDLLKAINAQLAYMCRDIRDNKNDHQPS